ncbi:MAG TPA: DNA repair protein RecO [Myxococcales bacterium]|nr:DNA repair protein RecO [Myxococcales bacterium]HIN85528.1 DNA repair protein RecO [Myxococcales bacterium]
MSVQAVDGIVLRLLDHGEKHRIVTFYTPSLGRLTAIARGARASKSRFGGHLDLFHCGQAMLKTRSNTHSMAVLTGFTANLPFEKIRQDIVRFATASFWAELVFKSTAEGDASEAQYNLLLNALNCLDESEQGIRRDLILGFQLQWFFAMGVLPELDDENLHLAQLPSLDDQNLALARALLSGMEIPELDGPLFVKVGALTRAIRERVIGRQLASVPFLFQMLSAE